MTCLPRFTRDPADGICRAFCRCGWNASAQDLTELQLLADAHRPSHPKREPLLRCDGFVSGLSQ